MGFGKNFIFEHMVGFFRKYWWNSSPDFRLVVAKSNPCVYISNYEDLASWTHRDGQNCVLDKFFWQTRMDSHWECCFFFLNYILIGFCHMYLGWNALVHGDLLAYLCSITSYVSVSYGLFHLFVSKFMSLQWIYIYI
jgi:hypothetical protein